MTTDFLCADLLCTEPVVASFSVSLPGRPSLLFLIPPCCSYGYALLGELSSALFRESRLGLSLYKRQYSMLASSSLSPAFRELHHFNTGETGTVYVTLM